ncbi:restriction endonuclease [Mucilaginibacter ginkgonis]|uniref:Restriction endonuclease n=1 Tax=Mucilaginibacter ginkgonis TaxID=2682091 RepID=A0A6I4I2Z5_9SPHI|nr:restriction endonuclease [Mucilaginibacter ginkgonis]QQL49666.1 restriction endonuclease [Mucilaginibacter ginkgonis]
MKKKYPGLPQVHDLYKPVVKALMQLGGSGSIEEINEKVYEDMKLPERVLSIQHTDGRTKLEYRLAWARSVLKMDGYLENSARSVWALKNPNIKLSDINILDIEKRRRSNDKTTIVDDALIKVKLDTESDNEILDWKGELLNKLYQITPSAFERLTQRLLRESGFIQVEVKGKTGDGGIDGKGIVRINGFLSFHVIFQCKRYKSSVSASQLRDFRGAMQGRADKGLFITTGTFTRDAEKEATRDGAPAIDLINGDLLCEKLKELKLGVEIELIENITINGNWFDQFN